MFRTIALASLGAAALVACHLRPAASPPNQAPPVAPAPSPSAPPPVAAKSEPPAVIIDASGIRLGQDAPVLVPMPSDPTRGADARFKRNGPNDLYLVPLAEAFEREHLSGSARVVIDPAAPYRMVIETLFTAGQSEIGSFDLIEAGTARTVHFVPPRARPALPSAEPHLNLTALIVHDGIGLKASGGNIAPGCNDVGAGLTLPRQGDALDLAALASCAKKLKAANPAYANERELVVAANPGTPFREVMDVAIALRELFPELMLAVPR